MLFERISKWQKISGEKFKENIYKIASKNFFISIQIIFLSWMCFFFTALKNKFLDNVQISSQFYIHSFRRFLARLSKSVLFKIIGNYLHFTVIQNLKKARIDFYLKFNLTRFLINKLGSCKIWKFPPLYVFIQIESR